MRGFKFFNINLINFILSFILVASIPSCSTVQKVKFSENKIGLAVRCMNINNCSTKAKTHCSGPVRVHNIGLPNIGLNTGPEDEREMLFECI